MRIIRIMNSSESKLAVQADTKPRTAPVPHTGAATVDSVDLLGSRNEVEISHQGETYRLRRTRQGKLILTK